MNTIQLKTEQNDGELISLGRKVEGLGTFYSPAAVVVIVQTAPFWKEGPSYKVNMEFIVLN